MANPLHHPRRTATQILSLQLIPTPAKQGQREHEKSEHDPDGHGSHAETALPQLPFLTQMGPHATGDAVVTSINRALGDAFKPGINSVPGLGFG